MNLLDTFCQAMSGNAGIVFRIQTLADAIPVLKSQIKEHRIAGPLRLAPSIASVWPGQTGMAITTGTTDGTDLLCLSRAWAGIADTGTLVLLSGPDNPTRLNFLADFHGVFLQEGRIVANKQAVWEQLQQQEQMPRAVNFISGPSRTADIEQTIQLGAHGPRSLWIFLHP